ncbi:Uncharacterized protein dnm_054370 [Desulfonema magnum]|uniref:Uncharacterized protein n=1 Tax=Desulfonema magnum TaxID=45655 RepID=A0A975BPN1_9BACT|nr:Uncharacterized protein dnm_054370 [Desulfonema magnum]
MPRRHEDTKFHEVSLRFLCVSVADFFGCVKGGTHPKYFYDQGAKNPAFS